MYERLSQRRAIKPQPGTNYSSTYFLKVFYFKWSSFSLYSSAHLKFKFETCYTVLLVVVKAIIKSFKVPQKVWKTLFPQPGLNQKALKASDQLGLVQSTSSVSHRGLYWLSYHSHIFCVLCMRQLHFFIYFFCFKCDFNEAERRRASPLVFVFASFTLWPRF